MNRPDYRRVRAFLARHHDPRRSLALASPFSLSGRALPLVPSLATARAILWAVRDATEFEILANAGFGIGATPMSLCAPLAEVAARLATRYTPLNYSIQSGHYVRVLDPGNYILRTGSDSDFHTWACAVGPENSLVFLDPQALWWSPRPVILWDYATPLYRDTNIAWRAHTATTNRVRALVSEPANAAVVDAIERRALQLAPGYLLSANDIGTDNDPRITADLQEIQRAHAVS